MYIGIIRKLGLKRVKAKRIFRLLDTKRKHFFHFVLTKELFDGIQRIKKLCGMGLATIIRKTGGLLLGIAKYYSHNKMIFECNPEINEDKEALMSEEIWVDIPEEFYREMKFTHLAANSFSIAHIFRIYLTILIELIETHGFEYVLKFHKPFYDSVMDETKKNNFFPHDNDTHVSDYGKKFSEFFVFFNKLCYPVCSVFP